MKKTLITLLALGGLVMGETSDLLTVSFNAPNSGWTASDSSGSAITSSGWSLVKISNGSETTLDSKTASNQLRPNVNVGDGSGDWKLSFTLTNSSNTAITLNDVVFDCFTFNSSNGYQNSSTNRIFTLTLTGNDITASTPANSIVIANRIVNGAGNPHPANDSGVFSFNLDGSGNTLQAGQSITLALTVDRGTETNGCYLGLNNITVKGAAVVPEPATATLSLLALAGLATRRRRK